MIAVGGDDLVARLVRVDETGRDRFLTDVEVEIAADLAGAETPLAGFLEKSDLHHLAVVLALGFRLPAQKRRYATSVRIGRRSRSPLPCRVLRGRHWWLLPGV